MPPLSLVEVQVSTHPCPEHVGGVAATLLIMLLTAAVRHNLFFQSLVPICVASYATTLPLSCEGKIIIIIIVFTFLPH